MSLPNPNEYSVAHIVKTQWIYKVKANIGMVLAVLILPFLNLISTGKDGYNSSGQLLSITLTSYNSNFVVMMLMLMICTLSFLMTIKWRREQDFTFVTNRLCSNLSTIAFLLLLSVFAGITASFGGLFARVLVYFNVGASKLMATGFAISPLYFLIGLMAAILYCILLSSVGFFLGSLFQNKLVLIILVAVLIIIGQACFFFQNSTWCIALNHFLDRYRGFFSNESCLGCFTIKVLIMSSGLYAGGLLLTNRLEAKR